MRKKQNFQTAIPFILIFMLLALVCSSCANENSKKYQYAEIHLNCENYSTVQNDPGNCMVIDGTSDGLRIQFGMIVTKDYVTSLMKDLGWKKESQTTKYVDVNGQSFKVDVFRFSRELK